MNNDSISTLCTELVKKYTSENLYVVPIESCTGGFIASSITNISGSSKILMQSHVVYSNEAKIKLGVSSDVIDKYTVYSKECAQDMLRAALLAKNLVSDINKTHAVAVTGTMDDLDDFYKTRAHICIGNNQEKIDLIYEGQDETRLDAKKSITTLVLNKLLEI